MRVLPDWKMKTAFGFPWPSRVSVPFKVSAVPVNTPATSVWPPSSPAAAPGPLLAASLKAMVRSDWACWATASVLWIVPFTMPGGKPVMEVPGKSPRLPLMTDGPVFVTVEPASTAKLAVVPRLTGASPAAAARVPDARAISARTSGTVSARTQRRGPTRRSLDGGAGRWIIRRAMRSPYGGRSRSRGVKSQGRMAAALTH